MVCQVAMDIDLPTELGSTEETVNALMEYLVGPLLPLKHTDTASETPSESKQKSVAKQVHAAAVLYNYYHLKQQRKSQFLKFEQFCNLVIKFKPSILHHMKYMCQSYRMILNEPENQLSLTEKAIMDACTLSETLLNASENISNIIKEWKITKVAVLLVDSKKENCFLQFNNGVWSVIEKEIPSKSKKRKATMSDEEGELTFQKLAFSAVEEVAGIVNDELKILESHVVYSLSEAKTAACFYIVQSTRSMSEDHLVPIQDVISSLHGPVVKECLGSWVITPVVEYYYLLPYAEIIINLFSRVSNLIPQQVQEESVDVNTIQGSQNSCEKEDGESKEVSDNLQKKSKLDSKTVNISYSVKEPHDSKVCKNTYNSNLCNATLEPASKVADDVITSQSIGRTGDQKVKETENCISNSTAVLSSDTLKQKDMIESQTTKFQTPLKVYRHERKSTSTRSTNCKFQENLKDSKKMSIVGQIKDEKNLNYQNNILEDLNSTVDTKKSELSVAALRALLYKRQKLYDQQQVIEGELTLCAKKIQAIMHGGIGDCLGLKLEAVIDCCNEICNQDAMQTQQLANLHVSRSLPLLSGKSLSEAQLTLRKACQELDDMCLTNNWKLPTYHTSPLDGGFVANVTLKEPGFECSGASGVQPSIHEARNSAATHVITRLHQMANG